MSRSDRNLATFLVSGMLHVAGDFHKQVDEL